MDEQLILAIAACKNELATNFDCPSEQILGFYGAQVGLTADQMRDKIMSLIG